MDPSRLRDALQADVAAQKVYRPSPSGKTPADLLAWCQAHIQIRGKPFSLEGHEYLREIYQVQHPYLVFQKGAQVGLSSRNLFEAFFLAETRGAKTLYYLSTDNDAFDFSNDRINIAIDDSEHLQALVDVRERGRDNVGLRHIGRGTLFCRGMFTRRKVKAVDGDLLVLDELDEADQGNKRFALDRILHSSLQYVRELSQPSIPDYGINESFQQTDQRYWHLRCPACGQWNSMDQHLEDREGRLVPRHLLPVRGNPTWARPGQKYYRGCLSCAAPLVMSQGEWVALYPHRQERQGYQLSQLYRELPVVGFADPADWLMDQILGARKTMDKLRVTISLLGRPYTGDRAPVTDTVLDHCEGEEGLLERGNGCLMGIDQGDTLHIVLGRPRGNRVQVVWMEVTEDWHRIPQLIQQFGVGCAVGDALPNKHSMKELAREASIPFFVQYFAGASLKEGEEGEGERAVPKVTVDRTESLDDTTAALKEGQVILPAMGKLGGDRLRTYETFRAQCKMLVKDLVEDGKGVPRWTYKYRVPNHFGMALNSMRIAGQIHRGIQVDYGQAATSGIKTVSSQADLQASLDGEESPPRWRRGSEGEGVLARASEGLTQGFGY